MDITPDVEDTLFEAQEIPDLPYDDLTPLTEEPPSLERRISDELGSGSLASRIGATKVYLIPETASGASRAGKVRMHNVYWGQDT